MTTSRDAAVSTDDHVAKLVRQLRVTQLALVAIALGGAGAFILDRRARNEPTKELVVGNVRIDESGIHIRDDKTGKELALAADLVTIKDSLNSLRANSHGWTSETGNDRSAILNDGELALYDGDNSQALTGKYARLRWSGGKTSLMLSTDQFGATLEAAEIGSTIKLSARGNIASLVGHANSQHSTSDGEWGLSADTTDAYLDVSSGHGPERVGVSAIDRGFRKKRD
jgi:hypothetical protein